MGEPSLPPIRLPFASRPHRARLLLLLLFLATCSLWVFLARASDGELSALLELLGRQHRSSLDSGLSDSSSSVAA